MNFVLELVSGPNIEPVTLTELKRHLRVEHTNDDDDITALIVAGREWVEDYTGRILIDQTWRLTLTYANTLASRMLTPVTVDQVTSASEILLRKSPVLSIDSVVTVDSAGDETTVAADTYELREADSKWPKIFGLNGTTWTADTTKIVFRAGYANRTLSPTETASVVPTRFKQAIKLWAEAHYDRDERTMQMLLDAAKNTIAPERTNLQIA